MSVYTYYFCRMMCFIIFSEVYIIYLGHVHSLLLLLLSHVLSTSAEYFLLTTSSLSLCVCVCVCVFVIERKRESERAKEKERELERERVCINFTSVCVVCRLGTKGYYRNMDNLIVSTPLKKISFPLLVTINCINNIRNR